jgi:hypothetical protein
MIYVSLDLGSESMAAYYSDALGRGDMIRLQQSADKLLDTRGLAGLEIDYLREEVPGGNGYGPVSPRMWNRVSLKGTRPQPQEIPEAHAWLRFLDNGQSNNNYQESIFNLFHNIGVWPPAAGVLPNPKILFQYQAEDILPKMEAKGGGFYNLSPLMLIKHLSLQIIINFVLDSEELRRYDRKDIHLTITVPNIYSLTHSENIRRFVREAVGVGEVEIISESDAVAYYVLSGQDPEKDPPDLYNFKGKLTESLTRKKRVCIVSIDVGKGTTDLSCILKEEPRKHKYKGEAEDMDMRQRHTVQGKTGKSSGGNYLNYIFAEHYDKRLKEVAAQLEAATGVNIQFGFLNEATNKEPQSKTVFALVNLIEQVKRHMTEEYEIDEQGFPPERERELLRAVADELLNAHDPTTPPEAIERYENFRRMFADALMLPRRLGESGWRTVLPLRRRKYDPTALDGPSPHPTPLTKELKRRIENYVKENVDEMLNNLKGLVREHEPGASSRAEIDRGAFVVVSGQGSQFRPLRRAIERKCDRMHIRKSHRHMMRGVDSKVACCKGVVNFRLENVLHINQKELHGTYGCLAHGVRPKLEQFKPFEMADIKNGGSSTISFVTPTTYYIVFTPRPLSEVKKTPPKKNDGSTAVIAVFEKTREFTIHYDRDRLELKVNDKLLELKTFGSVDGSIYPKVWPEVLKKPEANQ